LRELQLSAVSCFQQADGSEQLTAMTNGTDADFLQIRLGQVREDGLVYFVLAEGGLVSFEAEASQPTPNVHRRALTLWKRTNHGPGEIACPGPLWVKIDQFGYMVARLL
jgi:hypothetical protein